MPSFPASFTHVLAGAISVCAAIALPSSANAQTADEFYPGKTVTLILSTGTGGGFNLYAQAFTAHLGKHLPGNPSAIVKHMPGAGGLRATNFLYNVAPSDGATIGLVFGSMITADILLPEKARFDAAKFNWIGNLSSEPAFCVSWHTSKVRTLEDLKDRELIVGSAGQGGSFDIHPRVLSRVAGAKFKIVPGYKNGAAVLLAMERGEVDGRCGWPMAAIEATRANWLKEKKINLLAQFGLQKHSDFPDVPLILDLVANPDDRLAVELIMGDRQVQRPIVAPPKTPAALVSALRDAFAKTSKDPAFLAEVEKRKLFVAPNSGAEVQKLVERFHAAPEPVKARARALIAK